MNPQETFRQINILYYSLLAGQILFCLVILFAITDPAGRQSSWPAAPFGVFVPAMLAAMLPVAFLINRKRLAAGAGEANLADKLGHYRATVIMRSALAEAPNLVCLVIFLLQNNTTYLILFGAGLLAFWYFRPSASEFLQHYQLSSTEKREFA